MHEYISDIAAKLKEDSGQLSFTGFITNARFPTPPSLEGEIWHHVRAEASGKFADGHRIRTSWVVEMHACNESLWVVTENGSRYGILSIAPLGWLYFSNLYRASLQLDPMPKGTQIFDLQLSDSRESLLDPDVKSPRIIRRERAGSEPQDKGKGRRITTRPEQTEADNQLMTAYANSVSEMIEILKANGAEL